jgi:hypothetical protein
MPYSVRTVIARDSYFALSLRHTLPLRARLGLRGGLDLTQLPQVLGEFDRPPDIRILCALALAAGLLHKLAVCM